MPSRRIEIVFSGVVISTFADETSTLRDVIDAHYVQLMGGQVGPPPRPTDTWQDCDPEAVQAYQHHYSFDLCDPEATPPTTLHLIDLVQDVPGSRIHLIPSGRIRTDDSVCFYALSRQEEVLPSLLTVGNLQELETALFRFLERLLTDPNSFLLIGNYVRNNQAVHSRSYLQHQMPGRIWMEMSQPEMNYYLYLLIRLVNDLSHLNHCVKMRAIPNQSLLQETARAWISDYLYMIQTTMLLLLAIPEIFQRKFTNMDYKPGLKKLGIPFTSAQKDQDYYREAVIGKTLVEIYRPILARAAIDTYKDYIIFAKQAPLSDPSLGEIIHALRIVYNKLKHASHVQVRETRNHKREKQRELEDLEKEISQLSALFQRTPAQEQKLSELTFKRLIAERTSYAFKHIDWSSQDFKKQNGIDVYGDGSEARFSITLYDIEFAVRLLIGVLLAIARGANVA